MFQSFFLFHLYIFWSWVWAVYRYQKPSRYGAINIFFAISNQCQLLYEWWLMRLLIRWSNTWESFFVKVDKLSSNHYNINLCKFFNKVHIVYHLGILRKRFFVLFLRSVKFINICINVNIQEKKKNYKLKFNIRQRVTFKWFICFYIKCN